MWDPTKPHTQVDYLNNLKVLLIVLVVLHHSAEAYTVGQSWGVTSPVRTDILQPLLGINSTFFMGLFFLVSGYFVPGSLSRYKTAGFIRKKTRRLLIPALFVIVVVLPLAFSVFVPHQSFWQFYFHDWWSTRHFSLGHMWFVFQLFIYCVVYALVMPGFDPPTDRAGQRRPPNSSYIVAYAVGLGIATTLVNIVSPINTWFGFHLVEPYHLPQYVSLFIIGTLAGRHRWFEQIPSRTGHVWLVVSALLILAMIAFSRVAFKASGHLAHPVIFIWLGSFLCPALCTGLIVLFRDFLNRTDRLLGILSGNAYGVYLVHIPFVFFMDKKLVSVHAPVLVKFLLTFAFAYTASNILVWLVRMYRPIRKFV